DAALKTLIDEVMVTRIVGRIGDHGAPDLKSTRGGEGLIEVDRQPVPRVGCQILGELDDRLAMAWGARYRSLSLVCVVRRGEHAAIDHGVRENLRVEHVDQRDRVAARTLLHDEALEDLDLAAQETELARDGEAECVDRTAGLEETPERIRNAEVGLG